MFQSKVTRKHFLQQSLIVLSGLLVLSACNPANNNSNTKTIKVAIEPAFPPFESKSQDGRLEGFDIDVINAVAKEAGWTVSFESLPFDGIIPALQADRVDAAISAITITPERQKTVSFSRPYFKAGLAIAVRENNTDITSINNLQKKKIAVQIGTTGAEKAKSIPGAKVSQFDSAPLALLELSNGNVDAVINDAPVTLYAISAGKIKGIKVVGQLVTEEFYGIATPKDSKYINGINTALGKLIENGTYTKIYQKWFTAEPPKLPETVK